MRNVQNGVFECLSYSSCSRVACFPSLSTGIFVRPETGRQTSSTGQLSLYDSMESHLTAAVLQVETNVVVADTTDPSVTPSKSPPQWTTPPAR